MRLHVSVKSYEHEKKYRMMYTKLHTKNVPSYIDGLQSGEDPYSWRRWGVRAKETRKMDD